MEQAIERATNTGTESSTFKTRRRFLLGGAALAGGAAAASVMGGGEASAAGPVSAQSNVAGVAAVHGYHSNSGKGVWGRSVSGIGVWGTSEQNNGTGVYGYAAKMDAALSHGRPTAWRWMPRARRAWRSARGRTSRTR